MTLPLTYMRHVPVRLAMSRMATLLPVTRVMDCVALRPLSKTTMLARVEQRLPHGRLY